jgi:hypothetical protein
LMETKPSSAKAGGGFFVGLRRAEARIPLAAVGSSR